MKDREKRKIKNEKEINMTIEQTCEIYRMQHMLETHTNRMRKIKNENDKNENGRQ
jgi:hypothetical protein